MTSFIFGLISGSVFIILNMNYLVFIGYFSHFESSNSNGLGFVISLILGGILNIIANSEAPKL